MTVLNEYKAEKQKREYPQGGGEITPPPQRHTNQSINLKPRGNQNPPKPKYIEEIKLHTYNNQM